MIEVDVIEVAGRQLPAVTVQYPKTRLMSVTVPDVGYLMCGVLDVDALDRLHEEREIIAVRFEGIAKIRDLLDFPVHSATKKARAIGIKPGLTGEAAIVLMLEYQEATRRAASLICRS